MDIFVQIALNAIIAGAIYALIGLGFNIVYSIGKFFDLGYGALIALGGYSVFFLYKSLGWALLPSIFVGVIFCGLVGFLVEWFIYRPLRERKASNTVFLVASLGVLTVIQAIIAMLFSSQFQTLSKDVSSQKVFTIFGGVITETQSVILLTVLVLLALLTYVLKYTLFGKAVRAVSDDREVASIVGIDTKKIIAAMFFIGGCIAALSGIAVGFDTGIDPTMGMSLLLKGVIAVIIGGTGNILGGVIGAFFLATIENLGAWQFAGEWKDAIAFIVLIFFLLFRPKGIFSK
jgi:branched-chain amino acid transport system permease protein